MQARDGGAARRVSLSFSTRSCFASPPAYVPPTQICDCGSNGNGSGPTHTSGTSFFLVFAKMAHSRRPVQSGGAVGRDIENGPNAVVGIAFAFRNCQGSFLSWWACWRRCWWRDSPAPCTPRRPLSSPQRWPGAPQRPASPPRCPPLRRCGLRWRQGR